LTLRYDTITRDPPLIDISLLENPERAGRIFSAVVAPSARIRGIYAGFIADGIIAERGGAGSRIDKRRRISARDGLAAR